MSKPFWSKSSKNDDDDISSTHLFWSSLPQLEFDPSVTSFKSLLDIFWAGHDPTVPAYSRHVYNILHFFTFYIFKLSGSTCRQYSATATSNCILHASRWNLHRSTRRKKSKLWSSLQAISTRPKSESHPWDNSQDQTKLLPPQLPPEVHPPEARYSSHINRTLSWTKTCC